MKKFILLIPFYLLAFSIVVEAQSPNAFNYQAVIRDGSGTILANQNITLRASIVQGSINGNIDYIEVHQPATNTFGVVSLSIGSGNASQGTFSNIAWGNGDHFLKIEIDPQGGNNFITLGTTQLLSVPYALHSAEADFAQVAGTAESAGFAENATNAAQADFAANATNANQAFFAENATNAQTARFAEEAAFAQEAGNQFWNNNKDFIFYNEGGVKVAPSDVAIDNTAGAGLFVSGRDIEGSNFPMILSGNTSGQTFGTNTLGRLLRLTRTVEGTNFTGQTFDFGIDQNQTFFIQPLRRTGLNFEPAFSISMQQSFVGINTSSPQARLQVTDGDVYIDNIGSGVIMKDNTGNCWRLRVDSVGRVDITSIPCPGGE